MLFAAFPAAAATPTYYWDTNGSDPGPRQPTRRRLGSIDAELDLGSQRQQRHLCLPSRANVVFAATGDA